MGAVGVGEEARRDGSGCKATAFRTQQTIFLCASAPLRETLFRERLCFESFHSGSDSSRAKAQSFSELIPPGRGTRVFFTISSAVTEWFRIPGFMLSAFPHGPWSFSAHATQPSGFPHPGSGSRGYGVAALGASRAESASPPALKPAPPAARKHHPNSSIY